MQYFLLKKLHLLSERAFTTQIFFEKNKESAFVANWSWKCICSRKD